MTTAASDVVTLREQLRAATELLDRVSRPQESDIREALAGNICRCTGYIRIFESVVKAIELSRGARAK